MYHIVNDLFLCFPLRWFYIVVVPVTTSTLRRWENPEDMDLDEVSLWWSHTNNINRCFTLCWLIYVMNIHQYDATILLFHLLFFTSLSSSASGHQLLRHTGTLRTLKKLLLAFLSFCYYYWAFGGQHSSAFSWVCLLSINYRLQNRGNFSGAAYWISKRSSAVKITMVSPAFWNSPFSCSRSPPSCPLFMSVAESNERCIIGSRVVLVFITALILYSLQSSFSLLLDPICSAAILRPWIWFSLHQMCFTKAKEAAVCWLLW